MTSSTSMPSAAVLVEIFWVGAVGSLCFELGVFVLGGVHVVALGVVACGPEFGNEAKVGCRFLVCLATITSIATCCEMQRVRRGRGSRPLPQCSPRRVSIDMLVLRWWHNSCSRWGSYCLLLATTMAIPIWWRPLSHLWKSAVCPYRQARGIVRCPCRLACLSQTRCILPS